MNRCDIPRMSNAEFERALANSKAEWLRAEKAAEAFAKGLFPILKGDGKREGR